MRTLAWASVLALLILSGCESEPRSASPAVYQSNVGLYGEPPPPLPFYEQPPVPMEGYVWTPGYWGMGPSGYFWVPGTWVLPPAPGLLWTPGYWATSGRGYAFHPGYWAPHVGYYGGINYGHGYFGNGYVGGRWVDNRFQYNTAVTNVGNTTIHNTYSQTVVNNVTNVTRVSYVGGPNTRAQPTPEEAATAREPHRPPTTQQLQHESAARSEPQLDARRNEGRPPIAATPRPADLPPAAGTAGRPGDPSDRHADPDAGRAASRPMDHQRDVPDAGQGPDVRHPSDAGPRAEVQARQEQERRALAQQQEQERARFGSQPGHDQRQYQDLANRQQQQTQQMQQRHEQEKERASKNQASGSGPDDTH